MGMTDFSDQFRKIIICHKSIDFDLNAMRQSVCLVINPIRLITLLHSLIARRWIGRQTLLRPRLKAIHFNWLGPELFVCCLVKRGSTDDLRLLQISSGAI